MRQLKLRVMLGDKDHVAQNKYQSEFVYNIFLNELLLLISVLQDIEKAEESLGCIRHNMSLSFYIIIV